MPGWFAFERRWLRVLLSTIVPGNADWPGFDQVATERFTAQWQVAAPGMARFGLRLAVWLLQFVAPWLSGRFMPLSCQSGEIRERILADAEHSRLYLLRQLVLVAKTIACMAYFQDETMQKQARAL